MLPRSQEMGKKWLLNDPFTLGTYLAEWRGWTPGHQEGAEVWGR